MADITYPAAGGSAKKLKDQGGYHAEVIATDPANPLSVAGSPLAVVSSSAAEASKVLKASAGNLASLSVSLGAVAGWVMLFDATSAPADGAVTPKYAWPVPANGVFDKDWQAFASFATGITVVFSTTGPTTKTASATAFFSAQVQ
jgi:hypothetical protein